MLLFWQGGLLNRTGSGGLVSASMAPSPIGKADSWLLHALPDLAYRLKGRCGASCVHSQQLLHGDSMIVAGVTAHILLAS